MEPEGQGPEFCVNKKLLLPATQQTFYSVNISLRTAGPDSKPKLKLIGNVKGAEEEFLSQKASSVWAERVESIGHSERDHVVRTRATPKYLYLIKQLLGSQVTTHPPPFKRVINQSTVHPLATKDDEGRTKNLEPRETWPHGGISSTKEVAHGDDLLMQRAGKDGHLLAVNRGSTARATEARSGMSSVGSATEGPFLHATETSVTPLVIMIECP
ncbi:hypothetical protein BOTBODRAFT_47139 [Botryobasidium botryosum FD-172 SS1]|uniref:Uncharacterized protein n=1 Tax=Botryobasidium botryosum (strain FD-172 SS1) TaxID=930990 RepID=A0A067M6G1_BOTB1|nr:hypothetical protein BOTBODRAFT_47139 [Botryobasidium botryosum FD-172 SS1]